MKIKNILQSIFIFTFSFVILNATISRDVLIRRIDEARQELIRLEDEASERGQAITNLLRGNEEQRHRASILLRLNRADLPRRGVLQDQIDDLNAQLTSY
ncbi:MAG: hypothetical protein ABIF12_00235 [bacterium]